MTWPYLSAPTPIAIAHRGGNTVAPENTLAAFRHAVELGYLFLETDVHLSADGVLVAFHDGDLDRLAGQPVAIAELSWTEIQAIDLGDGHGIPRLEDLFTAFPDARFNIDPKSDDAVQPLTDLIVRHEMLHQVCVGSFSDDRIARAKGILGRQLCTSPGPTGVATVLAAAMVWPWWSPPYGCLQIPTRAYGFRLDRPWIIRRVQRLGLQVHFWTINERTDMTRLIEAGADALITDNIETLLDVLDGRDDATGADG